MMSWFIIGTSLPSGISLGISLASFGETWNSVIMTNIAMENPPNKWKFLAGKIIFLMGHGFHMLNNQRVYQWSTLLSLPVVLSVLKEHITCPMLHHLNMCENQKWVVFFKRVPYGKWPFNDEFMDDLPSGTGDFNGYVSWNQRVHAKSQIGGLAEDPASFSHVWYEGPRTCETLSAIPCQPGLVN